MMNDDLSTKTALIWDHGFFIPIARRLAKDFGRVLYHRPWSKAYPQINEGIIGDGFGDIECCLEPWLVKDEVDLFVFPDIYHRGEQHELRKQGFPVWGAGPSMMLETDREFFLDKLDQLGLEVPPHTRIKGLTELARFLLDKEDIWIKMSFWRGSWETYHWRSWDQDFHRLDSWRVKFGGASDRMKFICCDKIDTKLEIGGDTYTIDGLWPDLMLHGIECKDEAYLSAVTKRNKMPEELVSIMDAFSDYLNETEARTQWSMEVRVAEDASYFSDATLRGGLPSTASQILLWKNFSEIIWHGAHGRLIQPIPAAKFSAECMVKIKPEKGAWDSIELGELEEHMMASDCCQIDGRTWFPSDNDSPTDEIGWLACIGDTPTEVAQKMNDLADSLPNGADASVEALAEVIREIEDEETKGIKFSDVDMPDPSVVLEPS